MVFARSNGGYDLNEAIKGRIECEMAAHHLLTLGRRMLVGRIVFLPTSHHFCTWQQTLLQFVFDLFLLLITSQSV